MERDKLMLDIYKMLAKYISRHGQHNQDFAYAVRLLGVIDELDKPQLEALHGAMLTSTKDQLPPTFRFFYKKSQGIPLEEETV